MEVPTKFSPNAVFPAGSLVSLVAPHRKFLPARRREATRRIFAIITYIWTEKERLAYRTLYEQCQGICFDGYSLAPKIIILGLHSSGRSGGPTDSKSRRTNERRMDWNVSVSFAQ